MITMISISLRRRAFLKEESFLGRKVDVAKVLNNKRAGDGDRTHDVQLGNLDVFRK